MKRYRVKAWLVLSGEYEVEVEANSIEDAANIVDDQYFNPFDSDNSIENFLQCCGHTIEVTYDPEEV